MTQHDYTLDTYEQEILDELDKKDTFVGVLDFQERLKEMQQAVKEKYSKRRSISIRPLEYDIEKIKAKALEEWIPYQTLMNSILHKYATGKLVEKSNLD